MMQFFPKKPKIETASDEELLGFFLKEKNQEYLGELYERYIHLVFGICFKYLKDKEKAKDSVLNIYEKIQGEIHRHQIRNFKNWLYSVAKNYCLMELRKVENKSLTFTGDENFLAAAVEKEPELHPLDKDDEISDIDLNACLEKLKPVQQECIKLFYFGEKCYREIAVILNVVEKEVKSHLQNAKRNLKICLEKRR